MAGVREAIYRRLKRLKFGARDTDIALSAEGQRDLRLPPVSGTDVDPQIAALTRRNKTVAKFGGQ